MSEQTNPIISFKNFSFQYRAQKKPTLHDINLDIYPGERVLIAGPSGSGKSTLAACINGLNPFSNPGECTGSLTVDGVDAPNSSIFELSAHVGTVLQDPDGQFIGLTVGEDIAFALENSCVPQKEMHEITRHAADFLSQFASLFLGGGQPDGFEALSKDIFVLVRNMCQNISHEMYLTPLPTCSREAFADRCNKSGVCI